MGDTCAVRSGCVGCGGRPPVSTDTLEEAALKVLQEGDPWLKAEYGDLAGKLWLEGAIEKAYDESGPPLVVPSRPARLNIVCLVSPRDMPKLGRGGSLQSRQALVHSLVHTESWAIDLSWDIIARFGKLEAMPREFFDDFVRVAQDEGRHFLLLAARLKELGSSYGALPAHDGLWDSAEATAHDLKARLAVEHCVHEARGLDVLPTTVSRFQRGGDEKTAKLLNTVIYPEEITHCAAGVKWFTYLCLREDAKHITGQYLNRNECPGQSKDFESISESTASSKEDLDEKLVSNLELLNVEGQEPNSVEKGFRSETSGESSSIDLTQGAKWDTNRQSQNGERGHRDSSTIKHRGLASNVCVDRRDTPDCVVSTFHSVVRRYFRGPLKPPFNEAARAAAGFGPQWYLPLATKAPVT